MVNFLHPKQLLMTAALLLASVSSFAHDFEVDSIYYNVISLSDLTCEVTRDGNIMNHYAGDIVIPSTVTYNGRTLSVISIGDNAFYGCSDLTSINIPNNITSIGDCAFNDCSSLTSIKIPDGVTSIGNNAFRGCASLTSINIPDGVTSIESRTFENCCNLTMINIPYKVSSIGNYAFKWCKSLTSINIPDSVTSIGRYAFASCYGLTSITFGNGITSIENNAFESCWDLAFLTIGNVYTLSYKLDGNQSSIKAITIKDNFADDYITSISDFYNLKELKIETDKELTWKGDEPVTNAQYINLEVIVPQEKLSYYQTADKWKDFWNLKSSKDSTDTKPTCEAPTITFDNEAKELCFESATEGATFKYTITSDDMANEASTSGKTQLTGVYTITAYATADGMYNSETTTAKLVWVSAAIETDGILTAKADRGVVVSSNGDHINISGTVSGETIEVYNVGGSKVKSVSANGDNTTISGLQSGNVYIVKIGGTNVKVAM